MVETKISGGVLLVEDNPADRELARISIQAARLPGPVRHAECIEQALDLIKQAAPEVVLLDLGLPDSTGLEGILTISRTVPTVPIVVLSGQEDETLAVQAVESGAQDYLVKGDYTPKLLARVICYAAERKRVEQQLLYTARYDAITGLVNRSWFLGLLEHALNRARRDRRSLAVLFMDLDHFKNINDSLGHAAGDMLLKQVGERLHICSRVSDVVARLGGDEFTLLLENLDSPKSARIVAQKVISAMQPKFTIAGVDVVITPSIGIAFFPDAGEDAETLIKHADTAMYRAKAKGRNTVEFFTDDMNLAVRENFELECALHHALKNRELEVHYQPIIDRLSNRITVVEALLRWRRPAADSRDGVQIMPSDHFIPALERTGLIHETGAWVLEEACANCRNWQRRFNPELRVSVNVSPRQLANTGFTKRVQSILAATELDPASLEIEITEQVLMEKSQTNVSVLTELRELGVSIAIDDFGAGYSSLGYLINFPFDTVKLDKSFIEQLPAREDSRLITSGMLSIARGLGRRVVAEGVETAFQYEFLTEHQCSAFQGFLFSRPLPAGELEKLFCDSDAARMRFAGR